jgi:hypothetical protein
VTIPLGDGSRENEISNRIMHFKVEPPYYTIYKLVMAPEYVREKFLEALRDREEQESKHYLTLLKISLLWRLPLDDCLSILQIDSYQQGREFLVRSLGDGLGEIMNFPPRKPQIFNKLSECTNPIIYTPGARNLPCIDSLILGIGYFQRTLSLEHEIMKVEMKKTKSVIEMEKFYFLVPHTKYKEFEKQKYIGGNESDNNKSNNNESDSYGVDGETSSEKGIFRENGGPNWDNKKPKIERPKKNQALQEDLVRQNVISISPDEEMTGWIARAEQEEQVIQQDGKKGEKKEEEKEEEGMNMKRKEGADKKKKDINNKKKKGRTRGTQKT